MKFHTYKLLTLIFAFGFCQLDVSAQVFNDFCNSAENIEDPSNYCSDNGGFTNVNSLSSNIGLATCWADAQTNEDNDVWFTFVATGNSLSIVVSGANGTNTPGGTLNSPEVALYTGNCDDPTEVGCNSDSPGNGIIESAITNLIIGLRYFIRVNAREDNTGTFRLCTTNFNAVPEPSSDCPSSVILCDQSSFVVESLSGTGLFLDNLPISACDNGAACRLSESSSSWYTWTCEDSGSLAFTLTALQENDDLDFALYELPNGVGDCSELIELRCMLSGENQNQPFSDWERCVLQTGLSLADADIGETCGCQAGDNGFVSAVNIVQGRSYGLLINNFSESGNGFSIEFGGTSTFTGPQADFIITPETVECDRTVTVEDFSSFDSGNIIRKSWVFGQDAEPLTATGDGPFDIFYPSIGERFVVLTIETDEGCIVTEIKQLEITECCDIDSDIDVTIGSLSDPNCSDSTDGAISVLGSGGDPDYQFSLDDGPFVSSANFFSLPGGTYDIGIIDIKGCEGTIQATLEGPPPLIVDAGPDQIVDLGFTANIFAGLSPGGSNVDITWTPDTLLSCIDCLNPIAQPPGETTYTITVVNEAGCVDTDEITIFVNDVRPVFIPNVFSPNRDGINDFTAVFAGPAATIVAEMSIYDRWGEEVWRGVNLPLNDLNVGWNGVFRGDAMNQGVFVYKAAVTFIDGVTVVFSGDITLLR